jgi:recombination protein RecR
MNIEYSSKVFTKAVNSFASFPGIGKKTAVRLVLDLLKKEKEDLLSFAKCFENLAQNILYCEICHNLSDTKHCEICSNPHRNDEIICVVEDIRDVIAIENTLQFKGKYHILGGIISPMKGIHPSDLNIESLIIRIQDSSTRVAVKEVILALSTDVEGDTTNFYLYKQLKNFDLRMTTIARGIGMNDEIQYADEVTLGKSILNRIPIEQATIF